MGLIYLNEVRDASSFRKLLQEKQKEVYYLVSQHDENWFLTTPIPVYHIGNHPGEFHLSYFSTAVVSNSSIMGGIYELKEDYQLPSNDMRLPFMVALELQRTFLRLPIIYCHSFGMKFRIMEESDIMEMFLSL